MRTTIICFLMITASSIYSQNYEIGAMLIKGVTIKMGGDVSFRDGLVYIHYLTDAGDETTDYDIINVRNGITYVSDGTETYEIRIAQKDGKKKGFKHSHIMTFVQPSKEVYLYYVNKLN